MPHGAKGASRALFFGGIVQLSSGDHFQNKTSQKSVISFVVQGPYIMGNLSASIRSSTEDVMKAFDAWKWKGGQEIMSLIGYGCSYL